MEKKLVSSCEHIILEISGRHEYTGNISPVFLRYYEVISEEKSREKRYGVGIEKVTSDSTITFCESEFIEDIFSCPVKCKDFIDCLSQNIVTPTTLKDIVMDTIA